MIQAITKEHPIFDSEAYQRDVVVFQLMEVIKQAPMLLVSDGSTCILGMTSPQYPMWIWTADDLSVSVMEEICVFLYEQFQGEGVVRVVAKPAIAQTIAACFFKYKQASVHTLSMACFECRTLCLDKVCAVPIERASDDDVEDIAVCMQGFAFDCFGVESSFETSLEEAKRFIGEPRSFVIKQDDHVVAIAGSSRETERHIAINHVYTRPEFRGRGYAAALVAHSSGDILDAGKIPTLYTDLSNPASNKAYTNVGFVRCGYVDEITCRWTVEE